MLLTDKQKERQTNMQMLPKPNPLAMEVIFAQLEIGLLITYLRY